MLAATYIVEGFSAQPPATGGDTPIVPITPITPIMGASYCTYGPDYECHPETGRPPCCLVASGKSCPPEQPACAVPAKTDPGTLVAPDPCANEARVNGKIPITIAMEPQWSGYSSCTPKNATTDTWIGDCVGVVQPVIQSICAANDELACTPVITKWSNIWTGEIGEGFANKDFDAAAAAGITKPRIDSCMYYSNPYTEASKGYVLVKKGMATPLATLKEKHAADPENFKVKVCTLANWAIGSPFIIAQAEAAVKIGRAAQGADEAVAKTVFNSGLSFEVVEKTGAADAIAAINAGECDVYFSMGETSNGALDTVSTVHYTGNPITGHSVGGNALMFDGSNSRTACLVAQVNKGLKSIRDASSDGLAQVGADNSKAVDRTTVYTNKACTNNFLQG